MLNSIGGADLLGRLSIDMRRENLNLRFLCLPLLAAVLASCGSHDASDPLAGDTDETVSAVAATLEKTPSASRIPLLRQYLRSENPSLRYAAVDALGETKDPNVAPDIEGAFADSASIVRQRALEVLPDCDPQRGTRILLQGLIDHDRWIQQASAGQIFARVRGPKRALDGRVVPALMQAIENPDNYVSAESMAALRVLTGKPWRVRGVMNPSKRLAVEEQWRNWWKTAENQYPLPAEFARLKPVEQTRSDPAPKFEFKDLEGKAMNLEGQRGKVTLLNFWGTWCGGCRVEVPALVQLQKVDGPRGFEVLGIALSEPGGPEGVRRWAKEHGISYRLALGDKDLQRSFPDIESLPVSILIDRNGNVRYRWDGERDLETFRSAVDRLLSEP